MFFHIIFRFLGLTNHLKPSTMKKVTGSAAKRSGRCVMLELKERGVPGGEGTAIIPDTTPADR